MSEQTTQTPAELRARALTFRCPECGQTLKVMPDSGNVDRIPCLACQDDDRNVEMVPAN